MAERNFLSSNQARNLAFNLQVFKTKPGVENPISQQRVGLNFILPLLQAKYHSSATKLQNTDNNTSPNHVA